MYVCMYVLLLFNCRLGAAYKMNLKHTIKHNWR